MILDVSNNKDQKSKVAEVTKCRKVGLKFDKVNQKTGIRTHKSFHASVIQVVGYEKLTFDLKDVRSMLE
ncbi:hypothetical protein MKW92_025536 [Papaver armeniacum]|nr:hypothetical protein MKW92_025536 [Papaver armeniacum]